MTLRKFVQPVTVALAALVIAPATTLAAEFTTVGFGAASIQSTVDAFRAALGNPNNGVGGSFADGRREINWDAVPDRFSAPNDLPVDFFNVNSPRGAVFSTPGSAVQVSANAGVAPIEFDTINPTYSSDFDIFSAQKLFSAIDSNVVEVSFFIPGTKEPASVDGFGAVFTDVDLPDTTQIEYFDIKGNLLASAFAPAIGGIVPGVPADTSESLSFVGVTFDSASVARVRITNGNSALGLDDDPIDSNRDIVVMDDFIYGEPQQVQVVVPEPSSVLGLLALSSFGASLLIKRKKTF